MARRAMLYNSKWGVASFVKFQRHKTRAFKQQNNSKIENKQDEEGEQCRVSWNRGTVADSSTVGGFDCGWKFPSKKAHLFPTTLKKQATLRTLPQINVMFLPTAAPRVGKMIKKLIFLSFLERDKAAMGIVQAGDPLQHRIMQVI